ncbi:MAG TPA: hypothetical protein VH092_08600, partial [Urbifossiella sp.]|nr:hypothetical protein [Urbifossiella sp.]
MLKVLVGAVLFGWVLVGTPADPDAGKLTPAKLDGGYTIVSGEEDGKAVPESDIKGSVVKFAGNRITGTNKDKKDFFAAAYTLDASKSPAVIRMTSTVPKT